MKYRNTVKGIFQDRPNRFIAHVNINGKTETVHVKNTGRCKELLIPGAEVTLEICDNPSRKTKYDLISVYKENLGWVNIDSQAPNKIVAEWLKTNPSVFDNIVKIKQEYTYGKSRVDFYIETEKDKILMEIKGCTLELNGQGYFPDAPTERGVKHLKELTGAVKSGYKCYIGFVIALPGIKSVLPNIETHPQFGTALNEAVENGVEILYLTCDVTSDSLTVNNK